MNAFMFDSYEFSCILMAIFFDPIVLINEKDKLSFIYPLWNDRGRSCTTKYVREGEMINRYDDNELSENDPHMSTLMMVYDDEGIFGSGAIFKIKDGILFTGFHEAVRELDYVRKWSNMYSDQFDYRRK